MNKYQVNLIDNTYSMTDAQEVLLSLINDKIRFLNLKIFGIEERLGEDPTHTKERLVELKQEKEALTAWLKSLTMQHGHLVVDCKINIQYTNTEV